MIYPQDVELKMQWLFESLSEKDRRRYAAVEVVKLTHGGTEYISNLFDIDPKTIRRGLAELGVPEDPALNGIRKPGGGRKQLIGSQGMLEENFLKILEEFTAGDPMREGVLWTNLSRCEISRRLREMGTPASRYVVRKLLKKHDMGKRTARKKKSMGAHPDRNAQFDSMFKFLSLPFRSWLYRCVFQAAAGVGRSAFGEAIFETARRRSEGVGSCRPRSRVFICFFDGARTNSSLIFSLSCSSIFAGSLAMRIFRTNSRNACAYEACRRLPTVHAGVLFSRQASCSGWRSRAWSSNRLRITPRTDPSSPGCLANPAHPS